MRHETPKGHEYYMDFPQWQSNNWIDYPQNPVIGHFGQEGENVAIGDPQILTPGEFDNRWHAFYHGFYDEKFIPYYHHLVSTDGIRWQMEDKWQWNYNPSFLFRDSKRFYLYSTDILRDRADREKYGCSMIIRVKYTTDLKNWSESTDLIIPTLAWERESTPGFERVQARNPCMIKTYEGKYRLYYSAGTVKLEDCGYEEPRYIGFAESESPLGPFVKHGEPILKPDKSIPHRNLGAGAIKVFGYNGAYLALYNSIYTDSQNRSRSAINVLISQDGMDWLEAPYNPIIKPTEGWKRALVYQLDLVRVGNDLRMYYNARDGWDGGTEKIGFSYLLNDTTDVRKLWGAE